MHRGIDRTGLAKPGRAQVERPSAALLIRHRRRARPRPDGSHLGRWLALAMGILLTLVAFVASVAAATGGVALATVITFTKDLPDPALLEDLTLRPADHRLGPHRQDRARPLPGAGPARRPLRRAPATAPRRDHEHRGPDLLGERGLRPGGHPVRRRRPPDGRLGAGRIDGHPAARPRAPAARGARRRGRRRLPTQGRRDHPGGTGDGGVPGRGGQAPHHHGLPEPELLRARCLRHRQRGEHVLRRDRPVEADAGAGRPAGGPAEVALDARSLPVRQARQGRPARGRPDLAAGPASRLHPGHADRRALDPSDAG